MIVCVCSFTPQGRALEDRLTESLPDITWRSRSAAGDGASDTSAFVEQAFSRRLPVLFIGATGIAVRLIAPYVRDKLLDSPVLVMDEAGGFVIPLLSGHAGGANELARQIADKTGAVPVVTTATDVEDLFSVDVFASRNGLRILNRDGIRKVSSKLLAGGRISMWIGPDISFPASGIPEELVVVQSRRPPSCADVAVITEEMLPELDDASVSLILVPKVYCVGAGCRKGKPFSELEQFLLETLPPQVADGIFAISSVDVKKDEEGLMTLAQYHHVPLVTFPAEELAALDGVFSDSDFVRKAVGTGNVCERSAVAAAGRDGELVIRKTARDGMTLAVARRKPSVTTWTLR